MSYLGEQFGEDSGRRSDRNPPRTALLLLAQLLGGQLRARRGAEQVDQVLDRGATGWTSADGGRSDWRRRDGSRHDRSAPGGSISCPMASPPLRRRRCWRPSVLPAVTAGWSYTAPPPFDAPPVPPDVPSTASRAAASASEALLRAVKWVWAETSAANSPNSAGTVGLTVTAAATVSARWKNRRAVRGRILPAPRCAEFPGGVVVRASEENHRGPPNWSPRGYAICAYPSLESGSVSRWPDD